MPIFDQFENEPYVTYSGSYTDEYVYGSIYSASPAYNRGVIALKTTGIVSSSFYQKDLSRSDTLGYLSGNYISSRTQNLNIKCTDEAEYIYDSIVPSTIGITKVDGVLNPFLQTTSSWKQIFSASLPAAPYRKSLSDLSIHTILASQNLPIPTSSGDTLSVPDINSFTNNLWLASFPFQSRYKKLQRYLGVGLDNNVIEVDIYSGSFITPPSSSKEQGTLLYAYGDATYKVYAQYSQFWLGLGMKDDIYHAHIPTKKFNPIQKITYTNYSGSQTSCYVAFGERGTILTSSFGYPDTWEAICYRRTGGLLSSYGAAGAEENPIDITSWPASSTITGSIRDAIAIPVHISGKDGCHQQWALVVEANNGFVPVGKMVRTKSGLQKNPAYKIPTKDQWEYVNLDTQFGGYHVDIHGLAYTNPAGQYSAPLEFVPGLLVAGRIFDGVAPWSGLIGWCADANDPSLAAINWARETDPLSTGAGDTWLSITCNKWNDFAGYTFWTCGYTEGTPDVGKIVRGEFFPTSAYTDITPTGIFAPNPVPKLRSIAYNITSGSNPGISGLMCVGDNGTILYSANAGTNWSLRTPANGYTGSFVEVKKVYIMETSNPITLTGIQWIAIGDDGEMQFSTNLDGSNWYSFRTGKPSPGAIISEIEYPNRAYASASLGRSVGTDPEWKNFAYNLQNSSFRSYYAGSVERTLLTTNANISRPPYTMVAGGVSIHDFNKQTLGEPLTNSNTVLMCRVSDVSSSIKSGTIYGNADGNRLNGFLPQIGISAFNYISPISTWIKPTDYDYNKAFFGYGDGFTLDLSDWQYGGTLNVGRKGKTPTFLDWSPYDVYGQIDIAQFNLYNPQIRGWKYGLYSGLNTRTHAVWRRGKFGQYRDMLEQRLFTRYQLLEQSNPYYNAKNNLPIKRTVDGPIEISYVTSSLIYSQSIDYMTATNPAYNPYDSGIYDIYYRSGQPFFDRANED